MKVLLVNDDGIEANGLLALHSALLEAGHEVWTVAPATEKSGISQAITAGMGLKVTPRAMPGEWPGFAVDGTPADCACLGLSSLAPQVDVVLSGINNGPNIGYHVNYSGTVGAAAEAAVLGRPALAVSLGWSVDPFDVGVDEFLRAAQRPQGAFQGAARKAVTIMESWPELNLPPGLVLNMNFPPGPAENWQGLKWTGLSQNISLEHCSFLPDYEAAGAESRWYKRKLTPKIEPPAKGSDEYWITQGYVTVTPLQARTACGVILGHMGVG